MVAEESPGTAVTPVGAPGGPKGVTAMDGAEGGPVAIALRALTVTVYVMPFVSPLTVALVAEEPALAVKPPGAEVTVYPVIGLPPVHAWAGQPTGAEVLPEAPVMLCGVARV